MLYEAGDILNYVYFPTSAIASLLSVMENGASAEIAVVGKEGLVGISVFMGGGSMPSRAIVQIAGRGFRIQSDIVKEEFGRSGAVLHLFPRYTQALLTQMAQTAVCNRHHTLDQQLCRWLLLSLDRLTGDELVMTQELIAYMLGVCREGVARGAVKLQKAGLIRYTPGRITIVDRKGIGGTFVRMLQRGQTRIRSIATLSYWQCELLKVRMHRVGDGFTTAALHSGAAASCVSFLVSPAGW